MLSKTEIHEMGFSRGQSIGRYVPYVEKGPIEDTNAARELGITEVESLADVEMLYYHWAGEAESNSRDYSPFEFTAKELNDLEAEVDWEVWDAYNDAVYEGFESVWREISHVYRSRGYV